MVKVTFQYELQDNKGITIKSFWKNVMMLNAPNDNTTFQDGDWTWDSNRSIIHNIERDDYFVRTVEYNPRCIQDYEKMFKKLGWNKKAQS